MKSSIQNFDFFVNFQKLENASSIKVVVVVVVAAAAAAAAAVVVVVVSNRTFQDNVKIIQ